MITEFEEFIGSVRRALDEQDGDDALIGRIVKIYWDEIQATGYKCAAAEELLVALEWAMGCIASPIHDGSDGGPVSRHAMEYQNAVAAIAKAKGVETK